MEKLSTVQQNERERIAFAHIQGIQNQLEILGEAKFRLEQELAQLNGDIDAGKEAMLKLRRSLMIPSEVGEQSALPIDGSE